ncbi:MAG: hypothetical protein DAHOPDDO_02464 [Ignavibacteriaceae bacterium]|nr:hypothetical protein [Ignavibacteriaceae bacterium]
MKEPRLKIETEALDFNQNFGINVLPLIGKKPIGEWTHWQNTIQSIDDILAMDWGKNTTGLGAICGINDLLCLDLDKVKKEKILEKILEYLKLSKDYKWIVKTSTGYHIWIIVKDVDRIFKYFGKGFAYKKFYPKETETLKHLELRVKKCYAALPPSKHPNGDYYYFLNGKPDELPTESTGSAIIYTLGELFHQVDRQKILNKKDRWQPDLRFLDSAIKYLKNHRLDYDVWRDCCFALSSLGEKGRNYFRELSTNKFYPEDNNVTIDRQFDECLKRYDSRQIKLNTFFYYAKAYGFKYGNKRDTLSKVMLTYPLCILQCKDDVLVEQIISYGFIRLKEDELERGDVARNISNEEIHTFLNKYKIDYLNTTELKNNYLEIEQALTDFEMKQGTDAYGLIGLDFLLDCKAGKFSHNELRSYAAVKAILGRIKKWKWITYSRIQYAFIGCKSKKVYDDCSNADKLICERSLYRYFQKLKKKGFLAVCHYGRRTFYSTYLNQERLEMVVMKSILEKDNERLEKTNTNFTKTITEKRKALRLKKLNKIV